MYSLYEPARRLKITDDSGFLAIINSESYKSFVDEDWELIQLMNHFITEMNNKNIIFWATVRTPTDCFNLYSPKLRGK